MSRFGMIALCTLACFSLITNALLWIERRDLVCEIEELRASALALAAARNADSHAESVQGKLNVEAHREATEKYKALDDIDKNAAVLDDSAFLDALHGLLFRDETGIANPSREPAGTTAHPGNAGGTVAEP